MTAALPFIAVAMTGFQVLSSISGGQQQASAARYEAKVQQQQAEVQAQNYELQRQRAERDALLYEQEAVAIEQRAQTQEVQYRKEVARLRARQIAVAAGQGFTLEGSPLTIVSNDAAEAEYEAQLLRYDAKREAARYRDQADLTRSDARTLQWNADVARSSKETFAQAGEISARSSLLQGYSNAAGSVASFATSRSGQSLFGSGGGANTGLKTIPRLGTP